MIDDCNNAVKYDSFNIKAIYRRALAYVGLADNLPSVNLEQIQTHDLEVLNQRLKFLESAKHDLE